MQVSIKLQAELLKQNLAVMLVCENHLVLFQKAERNVYYAQ